MSKNEIPEKPILTNSVLVVKSTAALSAKVIKEIEEQKEEKDIEELLNETDRRNDQ